MDDGYLNRFLSRSPLWFRLMAVLVFVFSAETNNHQFHELSDPNSEDSSDRRCSSSRVISIRLYCDDCPCLRFVPGSFFHRWYLRFLTDALYPLHLFGDIIWVFDPGTNKNFSLKGMGLNKTRIGVTQGRSMTINRQRCARHYKGHGLIPHLQEGVRRRHNTSSRSFFRVQREADVLTITSKSRQQLKIMLKALWSLSYMLLAINIKYMKGGPIRHSLVARKAYVQQTGLNHSIIEATASHICEKRLYPSSLSLLFERICVSNLVYPNDVLLCY